MASRLLFVNTSWQKTLQQPRKQLLRKQFITNHHHHHKQQQQQLCAYSGSSSHGGYKNKHATHANWGTTRVAFAAASTAAAFAIWNESNDKNKDKTLLEHIASKNIEEEKKSKDSLEKETEVNDDDDDAEEDDETSCIICLINRRGPCRRYWRKLERCMKKSDSDDNNDNHDECDEFMIPWLTCVQSHRNIYTKITNSFYQETFIDAMELELDDNNKTLLSDGISTDSFLDLSLWNQHIQDMRENMNDPSEQDAVTTDDRDNSNNTVSIDGKNNDAKSDNDNNDCSISDEEDIQLVEARATINLKDLDTGCDIEIAYVKDQDGVVLGFDMFSRLKKKKEENETTVVLPKTGSCTFHIDPDSTRSIQVFALYKEPPNVQENEEEEVKTKERESEGKSDRAPIPTSTTRSKTRTEMLYYTSLIPLEQVVHSEKMVTDWKKTVE